MKNQIRGGVEISVNEVKKLSFGVKFCYGGAEGANSMIFTLFFVFGMYFLTDVANLAPAFAGLVLMTGTLWDAFADPAVGVISDRSKSKWGRRRPFLLAVALPYALVSWLLFTDFNVGPVWSQVYFIVMVILYFTAFAVLTVPYTALAAEMTQDYDERTSLVSYRAGWSQVVSLVGGGLPLIGAGYFASILGSERAGWSCMAAILGLSCVPMILVTWRATRGYEVFPEYTRVNVKDVFNAAFRNLAFSYTLGLYTFGLVGMTLAGSLAVYFMTYLMGFSEDQSSIGFAILFGCTVLWIPLINITSAKLGKRWAFIIFMGMWAAVQGIGIMFIKPGMDILFYCGMFFASAGVVAIYLLGWSMIPDVVEVDEFETGQRREGLCFGIIAFVQKTACAIALGLNGLVLSWVGYVPDVSQSEETLLGIRLLFCWGTASFFVISMIFAYFLPMTREKHEALRLAIQLRAEGKAFDEKSIEDLVK